MSRNRTTTGVVAPRWDSAHLLYLTAYQSIPLAPPLDLAVETLRLHRATRTALDLKTISANVDVHYFHHEIVVRVYTPNADAAFVELEELFRIWPYCQSGFVLLRYGPPGARERQVSLAEERGEREHPARAEQVL